MIEHKKIYMQCREAKQNKNVYFTGNYNEMKWKKIWIIEKKKCETKKKKEKKVTNKKYINYENVF